MHLHSWDLYAASSFCKIWKSPSLHSYQPQAHQHPQQVSPSPLSLSSHENEKSAFLPFIPDQQGRCQRGSHLYSSLWLLFCFIPLSLFLFISFLGNCSVFCLPAPREHLSQYKEPYQIILKHSARSHILASFRARSLWGPQTYMSSSCFLIVSLFCHAFP
jgi:hypothetical protein